MPPLFRIDDLLAGYQRDGRDFRYHETVRDDILNRRRCRRRRRLSPERDRATTELFISIFSFFLRFLCLRPERN